MNGQNMDPPTHIELLGQEYILKQNSSSYGAPG